HALLLLERQGAPEAAVPAYHHQAVYPPAPEDLGRLRPSLRLVELLRPGSAEDRPTALDDVRHAAGLQLLDVVLYQALETAEDARDQHAVVDGRPDDGAYGRVHARRVAAAGEYGHVLHERPVCHRSLARPWRRERRFRCMQQ